MKIFRYFLYFQASEPLKTRIFSHNEVEMPKNIKKYPKFYFFLFFHYFSAITISKPVATKQTILGYLNAPLRNLDHRFGQEYDFSWF